MFKPGSWFIIHLENVPFTWRNLWPVEVPGASASSSWREKSFIVRVRNPIHHWIHSCQEFERLILQCFLETQTSRFCKTATHLHSPIWSIFLVYIMEFETFVPQKWLVYEGPSRFIQGLPHRHHPFPPLHCKSPWYLCNLGHWGDQDEKNVLSTAENNL